MLIRRAPGELTYPLVSASKYRNRNPLALPEKGGCVQSEPGVQRGGKVLVRKQHDTYLQVGTSQQEVSERIKAFIANAFSFCSGRPPLDA